MSARDVIAECLEDEFGRHADARANTILEALTAAGYTIIRDDENHKATVERCIAVAEVAQAMREQLYIENGASINAFKAVQAEAIADALRSLIKEDGE